MNLSNLNREDKIELLLLLDEKERRIRQNPLKYKNPFVPKRHEKQIKFHTSKKRIRVFFGGNRTGKTEGGGHEAVCYVTGKHQYRDIDPGCEIWVGCPSFDVQKDTTQKKIEAYLPEGMIDHISYIHSGIWKEVLLTNGSKITFKSYEQGREKWQGAGKRLVWFDEEPPKEIWEEALMRHEAGVSLDVILTMTPVNGMTWIYDDIYLATDREDLEIIIAGWDDNPYLTEKQKADMGRGLSEDVIKVRRDGLFVSRVGLVCSFWDREKNIKNIDSVSNDWSYYEAVDGGWSDPLAYLLVGMSQSGDIYVIDGFSEKELGEDEIYKKRQSIVGNLLISQGIIDNDNPRLTMKLNDLGMNLVEIKKIVTDAGSWDEQLADVLHHFSKRLFIDRKLTWLIQQIENLKWLEVKRKEGMETRPKWDDHRRFGHHFDGVRALAYLLASEIIEPLSIEKQAETRIPGTYFKSIDTNEDYNAYEEVNFEEQF